MQPPQPRPRLDATSCAMLGAAAVCVLLAIGLSGYLYTLLNPSPVNVTTPTPATQTLASRPTVGSTKASLPTVTPTPQIHYPPTTGADLRALAGKGTVSALYEFHSESVGLTGVCPQPKREVTVDPSVTGEPLAEDLLAYFYTQQLDSPCGSVLFAYHTQAEANDPNSTGYTAGRILLDVTDSSGASNSDPNASNLTYTLTLDIGGSLTGQEYVVTY